MKRKVTFKCNILRFDYCLGVGVGFINVLDIAPNFSPPGLTFKSTILVCLVDDNDGVF